MFQLMVAVRALFLAHRDGVSVGGGGGERQMSAATAGLVDHFFQQVVRAFRVSGQDRFQRFDPFFLVFAGRCRWAVLGSPCLSTS